MGSFFTNIHVRASKVRPVDAALKILAKGDTFRSKPSGGWVSIYNETTDSQDVAELGQLAAGLSDQLSTVAVAFLVHDSDTTVLMVFEQGKPIGEVMLGATLTKVDEENSDSSAPSLTAPALMSCARAGASVNDLERLLKPAADGEAFLLEDGRVRELASLLGIDQDRAVLGFTYLAEGGENEAIPGLRRIAGGGRPSLLMAVARDNVARVQKALKAGADPNEPHVLAMALCSGHDAIASALLDAGADLWRVGNALRFSTNSGPAVFARILEMLKTDLGAMNWAIYDACGNVRRAENLRLLLAAGAQPNIMIDGGITPLMSAASWRNLQGVQALLEAGAWADLATPEGKTAADFARLPLFATGAPGSGGGSESDVPAIVALLEQAIKSSEKNRRPR